MPDLMAHFGARPDCIHCGEPLDDEDIENEASSHEECEQMRECPVHGYHDDPIEAEQHRDTYTDWSVHLPFQHGMHRGFPRELPGDVHQVVHDQSRPVAERAHALRSYLHREGFHGGTQEDIPWGSDTEGHLGVHWTPSEEAGKSWGSEDWDEGPVGVHGPKPSVTHIVLHAQSPERHEIEHDPDNLEARHMYGFDHPRSEHEIPLKYGAPVRLTGISWKRGGEHEWTRHDFGQPSHHLAADLLSHFAAWDPAVPLYHGSLDRFEPGTVLTPEGRNPGYSIHGGDYVHATTSPENARYFGSMRDFSPLTDTPVHVHKVEPVGDIEPYGMPGEDERFAHGNYRAKAFRVVDSYQAPGHYASLLAHFSTWRTAVAESEAFPNPYHGTARFGGRPEWNHTWFHGTKGTPEFGERRGDADRMKQQPGEREMTSGWPQPNKLLGVHLSPLHEVAHKFVGSVSSQHGALVHARLNFRDPAHYPTEDHLNLAVAQWADKHYPHWHDDKLNQSLQWSYSDRAGTRRAWHEEHLPGGEPNPHGLSDDELAERQWTNEDPSHPRYFKRVAGHAQQVLQWHPHLPEILGGFNQHLREQGHRGITYGNDVEGPYDTDLGRGGEAAMRAMQKTTEWPMNSPKHISAIAQPEDIQTTHVEHIAPWREQPQPHERTWEDASDGDEPDAMRDRVLAYHRFHGGEYPREPREPREAARQASSGGDDWDYSDGYVTCDQGHEHWGPHGAAFLLLRHTDDEGTKRYLLQKRTSTGATDHPGTWALPGGALHRGEDSYAGARREAAEEMGPLPRVKHHHTVHDDHGGWFADTHVADARDKFQPKGGGSTGFEAEGHAWFKQDEIQDLKDEGALHPGFAASWDKVRRSRVDKQASSRQLSLGQASLGRVRPGGSGQGLAVTAVWDYSGSEKTGLYLRFGHWPKSERSFSPAGGYHETGVSVYDLNKHGNPDIDHGLDRGHVHDEWCEPDCDLDTEGPDNDPREEMQGRLVKAERNRYYGEDKPDETAHLVRGEIAGVGYDGEPLLQHVRRVGDWIDHKHLFFPGAERHRLARDEHDEGYEPPRPRGTKTAALYRQYVQRIHPRDLLPYASREAWRMQDPSGSRHISELAEDIRQHGYQPRRHGGMSGDTHSYPPSHPITLVHDDENSWLWNGHHRTFALNEAGYDKPVPVLVKDFRTQGKTAAYYHGTRAEIPDGATLRSNLENRRVHFTTDPDQARLWGTDDYHEGPVRVYEVEPQGEVQEGRGVGGYASHDPVTVIRRHAITYGRGRAHWKQPPETRTGQPGEHMYRVQMPEYHEQTLAHGIPARPSAGMLPDDPPRAVYLTATDRVYHVPPEHGHPGTDAWRREMADHHMYKIDVSGLPLTEDRTYTNPKSGEKPAWMATQDIGPERISPHDPGSEHGVSYSDGTSWHPGQATAALPHQTAERPGTGPALHELADHPDYDREYGYGSGFYGPADQLRGIIDRARGKPDHPVTLYRAGGEIQPGDWVSLTPHYPQDFRPGEKVYSKTVPAAHARLAQSDWTDEFSYQPSPVKTAAADPDDEMERLLQRLSEVLSQPAPPSEHKPVLPSSGELYGGHIAQGPHGLLLAGQPPEHLYRVAHPSEMELARQRGYFQAHSGYTRASAAPDERWRHHTPGGDRADTYQIDYHPDDAWHASAEGYAATHARIPLHRVRKVGAADPQLEVHEYEGTVGDPSHITRSERGMIPVSEISNMRGARGERPGEHRNRQGEKWEDFKRDIAENGIRNPVFITVDHGQDPELNEGNHRRDAALELGLTHVPAEIRYYGHAERQGTVTERAARHTAMVP
jgi:8-oxo-dGTP pyrophosphatase MutT (NUDIX family)